MKRNAETSTRAEAKASARKNFKNPVGRAVQAAVCKAAEAGAIAARDSSSTDTRQGNERQGNGKFRCRTFPCPHFCDAKSQCRRGLHRLRCGGSTPPSCSLGLQALQRCSGFLNRRARGDTVATHQFERCKLQGDKLQVVAVRSALLQTCNLQLSTCNSNHASVVKSQSHSASNGEFAGGSPAGCTRLIYDLQFETACGLPRTAERPVSETVSLGGAIPLTPTIFHVLQSPSCRFRTASH